ncbi:MAG: amidase family protein, partial [Pseudomonadota bacterium]|nr:amidase family protein [Pseudomonadota bacterium]
PALRDAPPAARLREAGAVILGKTTMPDYGMLSSGLSSFHELTRNPWDLRLTPGGSSAGAAAGAAAGYGPLHLGTDIGGSVRLPAGWCGIFGLKPSLGRIPIFPPFAGRVAGPMTRSVADCVLLDGVVTGSRAAPAAPLKGLRLGVPRTHFWSPLDAETATLMEETLRRLKDAGAVLVEGDIADVGRLDNEAGFPIALYETVTDLEAYLRSHGSSLRYRDLVAQCASPDVAGMLQSLHGEGAIPEAVYRHALDVLRPQLQAAYREHFRRHDIAAVVFPSTPLPAAPIGEDETVLLNGERVPTFLTFIRNSGPGSVAGIPGISLPAAMTRAGLPLGLELDGAENDDAKLLAIAAAVEHVLPKQPAPRL